MALPSDRWIEVNLDNLTGNYNEIKTKCGGKKGVIPVVKLNGYGHGLAPVGLCLEKAGADLIAVSHFSEGKTLRDGGVTVPILLMVQPQKEVYSDCIANDFLPAIGDEADLKDFAVAAKTQNKQGIFHLKVNTGMNRFGVNPENIDSFLTELNKYPNIKLGGIFSHLATAMAKDSPGTKGQVALFDEAVAKCKAALNYDFDAHLANSAGALSLPNNRYDYVRVGTLLYGQYPSKSFKGTLNLKDTWQVKAKIIATRHLNKGEAIGYGGDFVCKKPMDVGVIPIGYGDGFGTVPPLNNISGKTLLRQVLKLLRSFILKRPNHAVYYNKTPLPVLGRIAMQTTVVDITGSGVKKGDVVSVPMRRTAASPLIPVVYLGTNSDI